MEKDREIQEKLEKYTVDVPYFPMKKTKIRQIVDWLFQTAPFPIPEHKVNFQIMYLLQVTPIIFSLMVSLWMIL
jgi:nucleosome binding factor SPN SPT16 subunit